MNRIYFDNVATTPIYPAVVEAMMPYFTQHFGNPSSIYSYGRETRLAIENARKTIASILHVRPSEIFFTSGGTESTNTAIKAAIKNLGCKKIITSKIEHHATLHTVQALQHSGDVVVYYVNLLPNGHIDMKHLEHLLSNSNEKCLVTLMHANNEIGNMISLRKTGKLCHAYRAIFHADCVQTVGHFPIDLSENNVDFISASCHKFHGPKGSGILYINGNVQIPPMLHGGAQERNMRAGTENLYGIVGFGKALEIAMENYNEDYAYISELKHYMIAQLKNNIEGVTFNGDYSGKSLYTLVSANFPKTEKSEMLLFNLDINNICVSGGSACSSGSSIGSHVIAVVNPDPKIVTVRFSFSRSNTKEEIDRVVNIIKTLV